MATLMDLKKLQLCAGIVCSNLESNDVYYDFVDGTDKKY